MLIHSSQYWFTFKRSLDWEKTSVMLWLTSSMSYYIVHVHQFFLFCVQRFNTSGVSTHNNVQCGCSTYSTRLALPRPNDLCTAFRPPPLSSGKSSGTTTGSLDRKRINSIDQWSCFQFCISFIICVHGKYTNRKHCQFNKKLLLLTVTEILKIDIEL